MNAVLPNTEFVGALSIKEIFDFFDGPKLFVCENLIGQDFLGYWIGLDVVGESYWIVPISKDRYNAIRSGSISLRDAITNPELGYLMQCRVSFDGNGTDLKLLVPSELDSDLIPDADEFISLYTETLPTRMASLDLPRKAVANQRDVLGLHFDFPGNREDGPTRFIGKLLVSIQEFLDALGQKISGVATIRGSISSEILLQTETRLVQAGGGSFGLEIQAARQTNMFAESLLSDTVREFLAVIEIGNNAEQLRERLLEMKPRAASKYGVLLNTLIASQSPLKLDWASPNTARNRSASIDLVTAANALKTVEQITREVGETRTLVGHFVGIELPRKSFTFEIDEEQEPYRGKIAEAAMSIAEHATLNRPYRVTIRETLEVTASGEEKSRLEVEKIEEVGS